MYRIMIVKKEGINKLDNFYQFLTTVDEYGNTVAYEAKDLPELDAKVEEMLNGVYAKKDFIIVEVKNYNIDADIAKNVIE